MEYEYDLIVIGAGSGGVRASRLASALGKKVAIIENKQVGGTCVQRGCVPKKIYMFASQFAKSFADAKAYGWDIKTPKFDWNHIVNSRGDELKRLEKVYHGILEKNNVEYIQGHATITSANTISVDGKELSTNRILIATGGKPFVPPFPGKEHMVTSDEIFTLPKFPQELLVIGGGYIATEFTGIFRRLGSNVTIMTNLDRILEVADQEAAAVVRKDFEYQGIQVRTEEGIENVEKLANGKLEVTFKNNEKKTYDCILAATGRRPNLDNLGLEDVGVTLTDRGFVQVNDSFQTNIPSIYALGDVVGRMTLTPIAIAEAKSFVAQIYQKQQTTPDYVNVPTAVFSQPSMAMCGLTEEQVMEQGLEATVYTTNFRSMYNSMAKSEERTFYKIIADKNSGQILGFHSVGNVMVNGELIQLIGVLMKAKATLDDIECTIPVHPTESEDIIFMLANPRPLKKHS